MSQVENLNANLGSGNDAIQLNQQPFAGSVRVNTGAGDDTVTLNAGAYRTTAETMRISTGAGNDHVEGVNTHLGYRARINTGSDHDTIDLGMVEAPRLGISTGSGDDQLSLSGGVFRGLQVSMGGGDDTLNLPFGADIDPSNYDQVGNDLELHLFENQSLSNVRFDGGSGTNTLNGIGQGIGPNTQKFTQGSGTYLARVAQASDFVWLDEVLFQEYSFSTKTFDNPE